MSYSPSDFVCSIAQQVNLLTAAEVRQINDSEGPEIAATLLTRALMTRMSALVMVSGGVAYEYAGRAVDIVVIDRDNIAAGDSPPELPRGVGFEALVEQAGLEEGTDYVWAD